MTLPEHSPSVINFQNLHVKKGLVSQRMKSMRYGYRVQNSDFDFPPENVKAII